MALEESDIEALRQIIRSEIARGTDPIRTEIQEFREEITGDLNEFRNETHSNFDVLFDRDEKRESENLMRDKQINEQGERISALEKMTA